MASGRRQLGTSAEPRGLWKRLGSEKASSLFTFHTQSVNESIQPTLPAFEARGKFPQRHLRLRGGLARQRRRAMHWLSLFPRVIGVSLAQTLKVFRNL